MRARAWLFGGALLTGCFDEGGDTTRTTAARAVVESMVALTDVQANLTTDPAKAGEAFVSFIRAPIAAANLLATPFDPAIATPPARRLAAPSMVPDCLTSHGATGCDGFVTNAGDRCAAGPFEFTGSGDRTCSPCANVAGTCAYTWDLVVDYAPGDVRLHVATRSAAAGTLISAGAISFDTTFDFLLVNDSYTVGGNVRVCSCGTITLASDHTPRSSSMVVKDVAAPLRCARVVFDATGAPSVSNDCVCADTTTCL